MNRNLSLGFALRGYFNESESVHMSRYCNYLGSPEEIKAYLDQHKIHEMIERNEKYFGASYLDK